MFRPSNERCKVTSGSCTAASEHIACCSCPRRHASCLRPWTAFRHPHHQEHDLNDAIAESCSALAPCGAWQGWPACHPIGWTLSLIHEVGCCSLRGRASSMGAGGAACQSTSTQTSFWQSLELNDAFLTNEQFPAIPSGAS